MAIVANRSRGFQATMGVMVVDMVCDLLVVRNCGGTLFRDFGFTVVEGRTRKGY